MRPLAYLTIPIILLAAACDPQPLGPDRAVPPAFAAVHTEITGTISEVDGPADCSADPSVGEIVLFTGLIYYVLTASEMPSGNMDTTVKFIYDPAIRLVGQTTGRVWTIDPTSTHPIFRQNIHGVGSTTKISEHEFYTGATGTRLMLMANFRVTVNANGTVTVSRDYVYTCIGG